MLKLVGAAGSRFLSDSVEYLNQNHRIIDKNKNLKKEKVWMFELLGAAGSRFLSPQAVPTDAHGYTGQRSDTL